MEYIGLVREQMRVMRGIRDNPAFLTLLLDRWLALPLTEVGLATRGPARRVCGFIVCSLPSWKP